MLNETQNIGSTTSSAINTLQARVQANWENHKVEILVGAAIMASGVAIVVLTGGVAAVAGAALAVWGAIFTSYQTFSPSQPLDERSIEMIEGTLENPDEVSFQDIRYLANQIELTETTIEFACNKTEEPLIETTIESSAPTSFHVPTALKVAGNFAALVALAGTAYVGYTNKDILINKGYAYGESLVNGGYDLGASAVNQVSEFTTSSLKEGYNLGASLFEQMSDFVRPSQEHSFPDFQAFNSTEDFTLEMCSVNEGYSLSDSLINKGYNLGASLLKQAANFVQPSQERSLPDFQASLTTQAFNYTGDFNLGTSPVEGGYGLSAFLVTPVSYLAQSSKELILSISQTFNSIENFGMATCEASIDECLLEEAPGSAQFSPEPLPAPRGLAAHQDAEPLPSLTPNLLQTSPTPVPNPRF